MNFRYLYRCSCGFETVTADDIKRECECGDTIALIRCADRLGFIQSDHLGDVLNPADGKRYDSKAAYYQAVANAGCNIVEDNPIERKRIDPHADLDVREDLSKAIDEVMGV